MGDGGIKRGRGDCPARDSYLRQDRTSFLTPASEPDGSRLPVNQTHQRRSTTWWAQVDFTVMRSEISIGGNRCRTVIKSLYRIGGQSNQQTQNRKREQSHPSTKRHTPLKNSDIHCTVEAVTDKWGGPTLMFKENLREHNSINSHIRCNYFFFTHGIKPRQRKQSYYYCIYSVICQITFWKIAPIINML